VYAENEFKVKDWSYNNIFKTLLFDLVKKFRLDKRSERKNIFCATFQTSFFRGSRSDSKTKKTTP
jgi:hypothetical protein